MRCHTLQSKNIPQDLNEFLLLIKDQLLLHFKDKIMGVYVYGSISYGDFEEHRSDVDVMVFLKSKLNPEEVETLKQVYEFPLIKKSKWLKKLEMDYIFIKGITPIKNTIKTICFRGERIVEASIEGLSMDLKNLLDCGITLYGDKAYTFIPAISEELLNEALWDKFRHLKENEPKWSKIDFLESDVYDGSTLQNYLFTGK